MKYIVSDLSAHGGPVNICAETADGEPIPLFTATVPRHADDDVDRAALAARIVALLSGGSRDDG